MLSHTRRKNSLDSQSEFCTHSVVYILCLVYILYSVCSLHFVLTGIRYSLFLVKVIRTTHAIYHKIPVSQFDIFVLFRVNTLLSFCKNLEITYNVSSNPLTPQKITRACMVCLCLNQTHICVHSCFLLERNFVFFFVPNFFVKLLVYPVTFFCLGMPVMQVSQICIQRAENSICYVV